MRTRSASEVIDQDRRQLLSTAAMGIAAAGVASLFPAYPAPAATGEEIRPFRINVPEEALVDLLRRINATRWPDRETVADESQGVQLAAMQEIARYWGTDYDWRKVEAKLNALPQFVTTIDGLDIHFLHVRSKHESALPLIVTHGWPGSIIEQLKIIDPLTNPTAHGASASDAFHLVIPSIPGYGFSARPTTTGWGPDRTARAWVVLMKRLGYQRFVAQGGDLGAVISHAMARQAPPELLGIHANDGRNGSGKIAVNAQQFRRRLPGHRMGDNRAEIAALRHESLISEALHQHDPGTCGAVRPPAGRGRPR